MLSTNFANFLGNAIQESVSTAGVCGITSIADPKAAAIGTLASSVAGYAFINVIGTSIDRDAGPVLYRRAKAVLCLGGFVAVKILAGGTAGRYYDKNFSYSDMCVAYAITFTVGSIAAQMLGIKNAGN